MANRVLFIQGGSEGAYDADAALVANLREKLSPSYDVRYPIMPNEDEPDYSAWKQKILDELAAIGDDVVLVGHSIGASVIAKLLTEQTFEQAVRAVFLISTPFWYDHEFWHWDEVKLPPDASASIPKNMPLYLYHGRSDESVPFDHMKMYAKALPQAILRPLDNRDHQVNEDLSEVARDIRALQ